MFKSRLITKIIKFILILTSVLVVVVTLVFWLVNLHDQPPSQDAQYFESSYKNRLKISEKNNAYIYVMGFSVADDQDPKVFGEKRIALIDGVLKGQTADLENDPLMKDIDFKSQRKNDIKVLADTCNIIINQKCLDALEHGEAAITAWINSENLLYRRYLELLEYSQYQETLVTDVNVPLANLAVLMDAQKLFLANAYLLAKRGDVKQVKMLLEKDVSYWRMALASTDTLIYKMIAVAALRRDFILGNFIIRKLPESTGVDAVPKAWFDPLSHLELSMLTSIRGEWLWSDKLIKNLERGVEYQPGVGYRKEQQKVKDLLMSIALQPQDSSNKHAQQLKELIDIFDVPLTQYPQAVENAKKQATLSNGHKFHIYNTVGNVLVNIALPAYGDYAIRVADLEGLRRAALLTSELRNQSLTAEAIPNYIANSTYRNPYTLKPFEWDAASKAVKFIGLERGERGTYLLAY